MASRQPSHVPISGKQGRLVPGGVTGLSHQNRKRQLTQSARLDRDQLARRLPGLLQGRQQRPVKVVSAADVEALLIWNIILTIDLVEESNLISRYS